MIHWRTLLLLSTVSAAVACAARRPAAAIAPDDETKCVYDLPLSDARLLELTVTEVPVRRILEDYERKYGEPWPFAKPIKVYSYTWRLTDREGRVEILYSFDHLVHDRDHLRAYSHDVSVLDAKVEDDGSFVLLFKQYGCSRAVVGGAKGVLIPTKQNDDCLLGDGSGGYTTHGTIQGSLADGTLKVTFLLHDGRVRGSYRLVKVKGKAAWKRLAADAGKEPKEELARKPKIEELWDITKLKLPEIRAPAAGEDADRNAKAEQAPEDPPDPPDPLH